MKVEEGVNGIIIKCRWKRCNRRNYKAKNKELYEAMKQECLQIEERCGRCKKHLILELSDGDITDVRANVTKGFSNVYKACQTCL